MAKKNRKDEQTKVVEKKLTGQLNEKEEQAENTEMDLLDPGYDVRADLRGKLTFFAVCVFLLWLGKIIFGL